MRTHNLCGLACGVLLLSSSVLAEAVLITGSYEFTSSPVATTYNYGPVDLASSDVALIVNGFNLDIADDPAFASNEWVDIDLNGVFTKRWGSLYSQGTAWVEAVTAREVTFSDTLTIGRDFWNSNIASALTLTLSWGDGVNYLTDLTPDRIEWSISYDETAPVPEPATIILIGTGLAGLAGTRLRRKK